MSRSVGTQEEVIDAAPGAAAALVLADIFATETGGSLQDRVFRALRSAILGGHLPAGGKITEQDVSAALSVSRTPLREAFRRLEAEGLVSPSPSRGVVVRGLTWQDFEDIYEIRAALEPLAASRTAARITPEIVDELRGYLELAEFLATKQRFKEVEHQNALFHRAIYRECGNARLRDTLAELSDYVHRSPLYQEHGPGSSLQLLNEHRRIFEAMATGDPKAAERAAREHSLANRHRVVEEPSQSAHRTAD
jgi:DNA-binding GntR family transcriptional regulator